MMSRDSSLSERYTPDGCSFSNWYFSIFDRIFLSKISLTLRYKNYWEKKSQKKHRSKFHNMHSFSLGNSFWFKLFNYIFFQCIGLQCRKVATKYAHKYIWRTGFVVYFRIKRIMIVLTVSTWLWTKRNFILFL